MATSNGKIPMPGAIGVDFRKGHNNDSNNTGSSISRNSSNRKSNDHAFSMCSPINAQQPLKSGYLDIVSGGFAQSPSRVYCVLSSKVLRCYTCSPDDTGSISESAVPEYELRMGDFSLTSTTCGRPQAFALINQKRTMNIEFLCRNIGSMNQWASLIQSQGRQASTPPAPQGTHVSSQGEAALSGPLAKLARRKALAAESALQQHDDMERRPRSGHRKKRHSRGDSVEERLHSSPTASFSTRLQDQEAGRRSAREQKASRLPSTSWQSNMHGDKKHSSKRFATSSERPEDLSASGNSMASDGKWSQRRGSRGVSAESRPGSSSADTHRGHGYGHGHGHSPGSASQQHRARVQHQLQEDPCSSDGESVSSSEPDDDIESHRDDDRSSFNSDDEEHRVHERRGGEQSRRAAVSRSSANKAPVERGRTRSVERQRAQLASESKLRNSNQKELRGGAPRAKTPSNPTTKSATKASSAPSSSSGASKQVSGRKGGRAEASGVPAGSTARPRKNSASPSSLHKDASVGFFDLYARHLNASKVLESSDKTENAEGTVSLSSDRRRPHASPSPTRQQHQSQPQAARGFGSVRNMSPAQRGELGLHVPPSINSALAKDSSAMNPLNRLRTPDDLRTKRPGASGAGSRQQFPQSAGRGIGDTGTGSGGGGGGSSVVATPTDTAEWTRLASWLHKIGMEKYAVAFRQAGVNKLSVVELLRPQDLATMRVSPQHIPTIMENIREISRRTLSYAESVASDKSASSPTSSQLSSPRRRPEVTPAPTGSKNGADILSSLSKRLQQRKGEPTASAVAVSVLGGASPRSPTQDPESRAMSTEMLLRALDMGHDQVFLRHWTWVQQSIGSRHDHHTTQLTDEFHTLDFYCRLFFAIRPILVNAGPDSTVSAMFRFKQYLEGFVSVTHRTSAQEVLMNSRLFAAYAGIVMVDDPPSNPAYASIFEPKWRQSLLGKLRSFLTSLQTFPDLRGDNVRDEPPPPPAPPPASSSQNQSPGQRPRLQSAEHEIRQALAALEASQTTLAASEKLNYLLRPDANSSPTSTAKAKEQYRATIPQDFAASTPAVAASSSASASAPPSSSSKIVLKPRNQSTAPSSSSSFSAAAAPRLATGVPLSKAHSLLPHVQASPGASGVNLHSGYLHKQAKKGWRLRYFQLDSGVLTYYLDDTLTSKKGELVLTASCTFVRLPVVDQAQAQAQGKEHSFQLIDSAFERVMVLCASDAESLTAWEECIQEVVMSLRALSVVAAPEDLESASRDHHEESAATRGLEVLTSKHSGDDDVFIADAHIANTNSTAHDSNTGLSESHVEGVAVLPTIEESESPALPTIREDDSSVDEAPATSADTMSDSVIRDKSQEDEEEEREEEEEACLRVSGSLVREPLRDAVAEEDLGSVGREGGGEDETSRVAGAGHSDTKGNGVEQSEDDALDLLPLDETETPASAAALKEDASHGGDENDDENDDVVVVDTQSEEDVNNVTGDVHIVATDVDVDVDVVIDEVGDVGDVHDSATRNGSGHADHANSDDDCDDEEEELGDEDVDNASSIDTPTDQHSSHSKKKKKKKN